MSKKIVQKVSKELDKVRLDIAVSGLFDLSRSSAQKVIKSGLVSVNDVAQTVPKYLVAEEDELSLREEEKERFNKEIPIIFEDEDILVIDKPAGITVHPAAGEKGETVIEVFAEKLHVNPDSDREGIVHRLDKGTSGVMVLAKNPEAQEKLKKEFQNREVKKAYIALVEGRVEPEVGKIDMPIERDPENREKMAARQSGKEAVTLYSTLERFENFSLLRLNPKTGRTHQIRVHLSAIGFPIVGDKRYGGKMNLTDRIFLHAETIELNHPSTGEPVRFESKLPKELEKVLASLN